MNLKLAFPVLLMSLSSGVFATPLTADNSYNRNVAAAVSQQRPESVPTKAHSALSIPLYLPLANGFQSAWSVPGSNGASQLTITPTADISGVKGIRVTSYESSNGTCSNQYEEGPYDIINSSGTVTLLGGHDYVTTDASNRALYDISQLVYLPRYDLKYQLLDNSLTVIATSPCIGGSGSDTCTSNENCGWNSVRNWTPSPPPSSY